MNNFKEHPILFSTPMVKAILEGRKTQTRRVMKPQPYEEYEKLLVGHYHPTKVDKYGEQYPGDQVFGAYSEDGEIGRICPYGQPGDRLWVRETWKTASESTSYIKGEKDIFIEYKAGFHFGFSQQKSRFEASDTETGLKAWGKTKAGNWRPSIHMPHWASRITLEITNIRVQRVQDISEHDAQVEGVEWCKSGVPDAKHHFMILWDSINAKRGYLWEVNPWVWAITFKKIEPAAENNREE